MSTETYWSCLTAHSEFQLGGGSPCRREDSAGYVAICPGIFPVFLAVVVTAVLHAFRHFLPLGQSSGSLSGRKPTLFLLTRPLSCRLKLGLMDLIWQEATGAKPGKNKKAKMCCTGVSWLYLSHEVFNNCSVTRGQKQRYRKQQSTQQSTLGPVSSKGSSVQGALWATSAPCRSQWPRGPARVCVLVPTLQSLGSAERGGHRCLRYPAVRMARVIPIVPGKKDELAFFSGDDGDVMVW